ncbi:MAG: hypothetical protein ABIG90_03145 [bacterium]
MQINKILKTKYQIPKQVAQEITQENQIKIQQKLEELKLKNPSAGQVYQALIHKSSEAEGELYRYIGRVDCGSENGMQALVDEALRLFPPKPGFFLKQDKAKEFLIQNPPLKVISALGYKDIDQILSRENLYEIYGSLRFVETPEWLNKFIENYQSLTKEDFEMRAIRVMVLSKRKWQDLSEQFTKKKYHNLTHLKELGVVFAIPREVSNEVGVALTSFSLLLHYFNEVSVYSQIIKNFDNNFASRLISLLKGEIKSVNGWHIISRYLQKDKNPDSRIFEPHINPEAIFWQKADQSLMRLAKELPGSSLDFWEDLDWVGDYFPGLDNKNRLITFNSVDISLSFANQLPLNKRYIYHFQEALWNKIYEKQFNKSPEEYLASSL